MAFSGFTYLFIFAPLFLAAYFLVPAGAGRARNLVLLAFGLLFYGCGGIKFLALLIFSIVCNYFLGLLAAPARPRSHFAVVAACFVNLALLGVFKYTPFAAQTVNALGLSLTVPEIALPIGISFYTFKGLSYVLDVRRGQTPPERSFLRVALYISFFPQVMSGPIGRWGDFAPYLDDRRCTLDGAAEGAVRFIFGLAKKLIIADSLGVMVDAIYAASGDLTVSLAWLAAVGYTLQIYFDFSGYSDMAIGFSKILGFETRENFDYPYISRSVSEFWRRWHISLGSWFRDYVYIPLGGNRCGALRQALNLLIVWALTGLWHGAAWTFVIWGLYYAALLMGERFVWGRMWDKLPSVLRIIGCFVAVTVGWVLFRSNGAAQAGQLLSAMFGGAAFADGRTTYYLFEYGWVLLLGLIAAAPVAPWLAVKLRARPEKTLGAAIYLWGPRILALGLLGLSYVALLGSTYHSFIYFNF